MHFYSTQKHLTANHLFEIQTFKNLYSVSLKLPVLWAWHCGHVGLCTHINPVGQGFKSCHCRFPSILFNERTRKERKRREEIESGNLIWIMNFKRWQRLALILNITQFKFVCITTPRGKFEPGSVEDGSWLNNSAHVA